MENKVYMSVFTIYNHAHNLTNVSHCIMTYVFPSIVFLAITGNTLLVLTILSDNLRKKSTGILLASSNVASIFFTVASLCIVYYPWIYTSEEFGESCNILVFGYHALATWSVYLLSCACVERYIAICHPLSKYAGSQNTLKQSLKIIFGSLLASVVLNCPMFWFAGLTVVQEMPEFGNLTFCHYFKDNWYMCFHEYIDLTFYSILPFFIISFCNMAIVRKTYFNRSVLDKFADRSEAENIARSSKEFLESFKPDALSNEKWRERGLNVELLDTTNERETADLETCEGNVLRCPKSKSGHIKNDMFTPDPINTGMGNIDNNQRTQNENNSRKTKLGSKSKVRKGHTCSLFERFKPGADSTTSYRLAQKLLNVRHGSSDSIGSRNKMKCLYNGGTYVTINDRKTKNHKTEPRASIPKRSQAFKLATILLPVSFLHLLFSLVVVVSIILEVFVTDRPCDKLLLLTVSYNAAQLQAGYHFYVNVAVSHVFRRSFKKMFLRKRC